MIEGQTMTPIIEIMEEEYLIPQLNRKRRIAALLPSNYYKTKKSYPVLYLHDGQNLFDDYAPFGNWGLDKTLAKMAQQGIGDVIIIAIDHGGKHRIQEYLPYPSLKYTDHQGQLYLKFMLDTLKPMVDKKYRVLSDRQNTGIGGSSMGGLISLHAGLKHAEIFGKMMIFSPSIWLSEQVFIDAAMFRPPSETKIYMYAGGNESKTLHNDMQRLEKIISDRSGFNKFISVKYTYKQSGTHQEHHWGLEFPKALKWLFY
jgi:predicted alpha/beta superfamily hydrolase